MSGFSALQKTTPVQTLKSRSTRSVSAGLTVWMGDSITANGYTAATSTAGQQFSPQSHAMWASLLSGGKIKVGGIFATGGYNTAQILATHLPSVLALNPRPQFAVVHAGTNDNGTLTEAQSRANLTSIFTQLLSAGITPVLTTMLPKQTLLTVSRAVLDRLTLFLTGFARDNGLPLIDWTTPFIDPNNGNWVGYNATGGTYQVDSTHPNGAGAKIMGQAVATALSPMSTAAPYFAAAANQPNATWGPSNGNATLLSDSNANGRPNGMDYVSDASGTFTLTSVPAGEGTGNYYNMARAGTDFVAQGDSAAVTPGNTMLLSIRLKTANVKATGATFHVRLCTGSTGANDLLALRSWTEDLPAGSHFQMKFVVPSGWTGTASLWANVTGGNATLSIANVGIIDLTAAGIA